MAEDRRCLGVRCEAEGKEVTEFKGVLIQTRCRE